MLHALTEYADRRGIRGEAGFTNKRIRWLINFSPGGKYLGLVEQSQPGSRPGVGRECKKVPHLKFSGDTPMRQFLVDTAQYVFLYAEENPAQKLIAKHEYFLRLLHDAGKAEPFLAHVAASLCKADVCKTICRDLESQSPKAKPSDNVTFAEMCPQRPRIHARR